MRVRGGSFRAVGCCSSTPAASRRSSPMPRAWGHGSRKRRTDASAEAKRRPGSGVGEAGGGGRRRRGARLAQDPRPQRPQLGPLKDYYVLWIIGQVFEIDRSRLAAAISATFARRGTAIPDGVPDGLSPAFAEDAAKRQQWESFKQDLSVDPGPLDGVVSALEAVLMPAAAVARDRGGPDSRQL